MPNDPEACLGVLVSSTYRDLKAEREVVRGVIDDLSARLPVRWVGMEEFGALHASPFEVSQAFAEKADLVVLIVGHASGTAAPDRNMSFTEAELEIVLRDKIPCLVYMKPADDSALPLAIAAFRARINGELTSTSFTTLGELERSVRRDLENELRNFLTERSAAAAELEAPPFLDTSTFRGRAEETRRLGDSLAKENARAGIWGVRGSGKTTFVQHFFDEQRSRFDPIWLRVDDLFGRFPNGRQRIGVSRWLKEPLLARLGELLKERSRAVLVFDNIQAAPLLVRWLGDRLGACRAIFIGWDLQALPACGVIIRLAPRLEETDSRSVLSAYCHPEQAYDDDALARLAACLEHHPLLLALAGHQLRADDNLRASDILARVANAQGRLLLQGPTGGESDVVCDLLLSAYQCLVERDRSALAALSALPSRGISAESLRWVTAPVPAGEATDLPRARELGLLDLGPVVDWRGHRYRLRSLISDFLHGTDAFPPASKRVEAYLQSEDALADASVDIVTTALRCRFDRHASELPTTSWGEALLVNARPAIRESVREVLAQHRAHAVAGPIARLVEDLTRTPRTEAITVELLELLARWQTAERLEEIFLRPMVVEDGERTSSTRVALAAARGLASIRGVSVEDFLKERLRSASRPQVLAALLAVREHAREGLEEPVVALLSSPSPRLRAEAADALAYMEDGHSREAADRLFAVYESDPDEEVREMAASSLGAWTDDRILPHFLDRLRHPDFEEWATACSILWRYRQGTVADAIHERLEEVPAGELHTCETAIFVLSDFGDARAGAHVLRFARAVSEPRGRLLAAFFVGQLRDEGLPSALRVQLGDLLVGWLDTSDRRLALTVQSSLIRLRDARGGEQLWEALRADAGGDQANQWRAMVLGALASWRPDGFEPSRLRPLLHDASPDVRASAALVAGQVRARDLADDLVELTADEALSSLGQKTVGRAAGEALDRIEGKRPPWQAAARPPVLSQ